MEMMDALEKRQQQMLDHIAAIADRPCVWGVDDCSRWPADWVERVRGIDLRLPAYASEAEARSRIAAAGSLLVLWNDALQRAGFVEALAPAYGDVGVVQLAVGQRGCIMLHDGLCVFRSDVGVVMIRPRRPLKFWQV